MRAYYSEKVGKFLNTSDNEILGQLLRNHCFSNDFEQKRAWAQQIKILKKTLLIFKMQLYFSNLLYPIYITRDLETAKTWVKNKARGTQRIGLLAHSNAIRL